MVRYWNSLTNNVQTNIRIENLKVAVSPMLEMNNNVVFIFDYIIYLLVWSERKPNFELTSLPFGINGPVYDNTGKFQHSCKDTKMTSLQPDFSEA